MTPIRHPDMTVWSKYAAGALTPAERREAEEHLYACEECLLLYIDCVDAAANDAAEPVFAGMEDAVLAEIGRQRAAGELHADIPGPYADSPETAAPAPFADLPAASALNQAAFTASAPVRAASEAAPAAPVASQTAPARHAAPGPAAAGTPGAARSAAPAPRRWTSHPLFHYTVAACVTILLMTSGVFRLLVEQPGEWRSARLAEERRASLSERWTEQAVDALDVLQTKLKEGSSNGP